MRFHPKDLKRIVADALDEVLDNEQMEYRQTIEAKQSNLSLRGILRGMMILSNKKGYGRNRRLEADNESEWVADLNWNGWPECFGILIKEQEREDRRIDQLNFFR